MMSAGRTYNLGDSSDEEIPVPIFNCSALTNALLNDVNSSADLPRSRLIRSSPETEQRHLKMKVGSKDVLDKQDALHSTNEQIPYPKRIVRLSRPPGYSSIHRSKSVSLTDQKDNKSTVERSHGFSDLSTPAPAPKRIVRLSISTGKDRDTFDSPSKHSSSGDSILSPKEDEIEPLEYPRTTSRPTISVNQGSVSKYGQSTIGRARNGEDAGVKKIAGAFMSVRPRRGRRRISDEEQSPANESSAPSTQGLVNRELEQVSRSQCSPSAQEHQSNLGLIHQSQYNSGSPISSNKISDSILRSKSPASSGSRPGSSQSRGSLQDPQLRQQIKSSKPVPISKGSHPDLPSTHDQENQIHSIPNYSKQAPPVLPTAKLVNTQARHHEKASADLQAKLLSERPVLASRSQNTPRRLAPPPPKMSILDAATSNAGAAATSNPSSKRNRMKINGKIFTRLDCIGRGGSSRVYRVMAENSKFFALKKVSLDDVDESAIRGFKGEIDLLKKLENVDRVIRLYDFELNEDKGTLMVLMELGELDMNKILDVRLKSENSKFDPSFVRYYWKEMLECLQVIHEHDIVHSDLKPHNFVLVQGRLKLIDFGIANAIQTDETVNVHRETQIGTPNYMSPESLIDSNAKPDMHGRIPNAPKLMKLGKPSDIWSLGCILYQMTYGRAPFAHIQNQMQRCHAIINHNYAITYPSVGVGNIPVPSSLIKTLKKCLNRDQRLRPSAKELLNEKDIFLYPNELDEQEFPLTEELLGRILLNVAAKFKDKTPTDAELLKVWPQGYFERLRKNKS
ncbi:Serine/threonine-protein kinase LATS2 [Golovinomyces cichoracearum]|uniref:Serine/threonine-protein kinase LATS2 n=1 Tax=Golovinomyces cichoracearum TaxID=62708 RepID=A0A420IJR9_9PEZI|nr:Serine/threonine-protein kinase LATS2 [Golovinomyces cichoracearum]